MDRDWVQFALKLAENARAGVAKDLARLAEIRAAKERLRKKEPH
jgi:hypothetical protein